MKRKTRATLGSISRLLLITPLLLFIVMPFVITVGNTFKTEGEINSLVPHIVPRNPTLDNVVEFFNDPFSLTGLGNSFLISSSTMMACLLIAFPAAYALSRFKTRLSPVLQSWVLGSYMIPVISLTVPLFVILRTVRLTDSRVGLLLVYTIWCVPFALWMLQGFVAGSPRELEEAGRMDGCNTLQIMLRILLPNILPGVLTAGILTFVTTWNEFFFALVFLKSPDKLTLSMALYSYIGIQGQARDGMLAAASLISSIPGILAFSFFQRFYVSGMTTGAVK